MSPAPDPAAAARVRALARAALARPASPFRELPPRVLLVDVEGQRLFLVEGGRPAEEFRVSTAAFGVCGREGSLGTPPGWHRIQARIGDEAPPGAVFVEREATGEVWRGEPREEDLILTRILTLDGLEEGVNRGAGCDSLARHIYLHGTNHEGQLGLAVSHGCVRLAGADMARLFARVVEGDAVAVVPSAMPDPAGSARFHYAGLGGSGMSALAQFQVMSGGRASGSDRSFDRGERAATRAAFERLGISVHPQDGSGLGGDCEALVVSTAVEAEVPDVAAARARDLAIVHRSELLARFAAAHRTVAVTGTSGKSTVVAMIFEILRGAGRDPSVLGGGELVALAAEGLLGNAWRGGSDLLVIEADESDGSLVRYSPAVGVVLNLQRDHRETSEVAEMFAVFRRRTRETFVAGEAPNLRGLARDAVLFGFGPAAAVRGEEVELGPDGSRFAVEGVRFELPAPGRHNVENALAAIAACRALGVALAETAAPLARFRGVARRFQSLGSARAVEVVDDFAHNPAKIAASLAAAHARAERVLAVYQPHGYGPTRFLRRDLVDTFTKALTPADRLWFLEVFYAGGTAVRDFSSADIASQIAARGVRAEFTPSRATLVARLAAEARAGDLILVMGARDPTLTELAREILRALEGVPLKSS